MCKWHYNVIAVLLIKNVLDTIPVVEPVCL